MAGLTKLYRKLLTRYGPQGWWPLLELHRGRKGTNPTKTGSMRGYHPGDFSYPRTERQRFEIAVGAILTQNTSWVNVEKALLALEKAGLIDPERMRMAREEELRMPIRPAGYFNQKAKKLKAFAAFYRALEGRTPTREELLALWGIGPETADSILLYAYRVPEFVIDAYTRRVLAAQGFLTGKETYDKVKAFCEKGLPKDVKTYQEFHALLVEHAKRLRPARRAGRPGKKPVRKE